MNLVSSVVIAVNARTTVDPDARHHDEVEPYRREIWGELVHHRFELTGNDDSLFPTGVFAPHKEFRSREELRYRLR